jgi:hypothetical protein
MSNLNDQKKDLHNFSKDAIEQGKDKASSTYEKVKDEAKSLSDNAQDKASDALKAGKKTVKNIEDNLNGYVKSIDKSIANKPILSMLGAIGFGFALFALFKN